MDWIEILSRVIIEIVIPLVAVWAGARLSGWLRQQGLAVEEARIQRQLREVMEMVVRWAEQRYGDEPGAYRRTQAQRMLGALGFNPQDPQVDAALEATVNELSTYEFDRE